MEESNGGGRVRDKREIGEEIKSSYGGKELTGVAIDTGYEIARRVFGLEDGDARIFARLYADHAITVFNPENEGIVRRRSGLKKEELQNMPPKELENTPAEERMIRFLEEMAKQGKIHLPESTDKD